MIVRTPRKKRFTIVDNQLINDPSIEWNDLGLLLFLLSKPDGWEISVPHLISLRKAGRTAIYASLKRLQNAGYASYVRNSNGTTDWEIYDSKQTDKSIPKATTKKYPYVKNQHVENPREENPCYEKPYEEKPDQENPHMEKPNVDNRHHIINTDLKENTKLLKTSENSIETKILAEKDTELAHFIYFKIKEMSPTYKPPDFRKWANTIRHMRKKDEREPSQIKATFLWAHSDKFWKNIIHNPQSLRKHFDRLYIQYLSHKREPNNECRLANLQQRIEAENRADMELIEQFRSRME